MKIVAISDVHEKWHKLKIPQCDILISCGDYSFRGDRRIVQEFHEWLDKQDARYVISVQGNHELWVEKNFPEAKDIAERACPGIHFIDNHGIEIEGIKIWGSAITPFFCDWAWNKHRGDAIQPYWDAIPDDTQILITHGPPYGILDQTTYADGTIRQDRLGCYQLMKRIKDLKNLKLHFFGHIHAQGGQQVHKDGVSFYNASICDESYSPNNPITMVEYEND